MDFFADLDRLAKGMMRQRGFHIPREEPGEDNFTEKLLHILLLDEAKNIVPIPRTVEESDTIEKRLKEIPEHRRIAYAAIKKKLEDGEDVLGHLSDKAKKSKFTDLLLADWGIHHLHLSIHKKKPSDRFYQRSGFLAFVKIELDKALIVDIRPHGEDSVFCKRELLEILHRNWPDQLEPHRLRSVIDVAYEPSDEERHALRKAGVNVITKIGDAVYMGPGGGITGAATSLTVGMQVDRVMRTVKHFEETATNRQQVIAQRLGVPDHQVKLELRFDRGMRVFETTTNSDVTRLLS